MGKSVTFIHAADLHLGAPFRGLCAVSPTWADRLIRAIPEAYERIIEEALNAQVDFVVFAGDTFDNSHPSYADFALFIEGLKKLEEAHIPVYLCTGNHDPYTAWKQDFADLPSNAHVFNPTQASFQVYAKHDEPLAILAGRSYYTQAWSANEDIDAGISRDEAFKATNTFAPFVIGVIHTGLNIDPTRSPADPQRLLGKNLDYWACGHIHQPMCFPEVSPKIVFSGCPQGRSIKEQGERGVFKVTLSENTPVQLEFVPTASVVWERLQVDVSTCATIADIQELIANEQFVRNSVGRCQNMVCRVELGGNTKLHSELIPQVLEDVRQILNRQYPFFYIDAIDNATHPVIDRSLLQKEGLFPAVFLNELDAERQDTAATLSYLEKQFYHKDLSLPSGLSHALPELYEQAETLVLDLLHTGSSS